MFWNKKKKQDKEIIMASCVYSCLKEKCPKWVTLTTLVKIEGQDKLQPKLEGKCADVWKVILMVELRQAIEGLKIPRGA